MIFLKILLTSLLPLVFSLESQSNTSQCVSLVDGKIFSVQIKKSNNYENCFVLNNLPPTSQLMIDISGGVQNTIRLFERNSSTSTTSIADYTSTVSGLSINQVDVLSRTIGFEIVPTSHLNSNKNVKISYWIVNGQPFVGVTLEEIPNQLKRL